MSQYSNKRIRKPQNKQQQFQEKYDCISNRTRSNYKRNINKRNNKFSNKTYNHESMNINGSQFPKALKSKTIAKRKTKHKYQQKKKQQKLQKLKVQKTLNKNTENKITQQKIIANNQEKMQKKIEANKFIKQRQDIDQDKEKLAFFGKKVKLQKSRSQQPKKSNYEYIDICFCIDATGSMMAEIYELQNVITNIIQKIQNTFATEYISLRFAIVSYRDHNPQETTYVTKFLDFTDHEQSIAYLKTLSAFGGGDEAEAVLDGLHQSVHSLNWAKTPYIKTKKYLIHIADAQPHGKQFGNDEQQLGCTCGIQTQDVIHRINSNDIAYVFMKIRNNKKLDLMQKLFKDKIRNFRSTKIEHAKEMVAFIPRIIAEELASL